MPVPPRCPFHQDAHSTKMPILPRCLFHKTLKIIPLLSKAEKVKGVKDGNQSLRHFGGKNHPDYHGHLAGR
ncbi:MAG: hypothetical protein F6J90_06710 [Moorea sp. SIOASIH]|nr:hypothetical protein [Moorena sp. SIOASIH]